MNSESMESGHFIEDLLNALQECVSLYEALPETPPRSHFFKLWKGKAAIREFVASPGDFDTGEILWFCHDIMRELSGRSVEADAAAKVLKKLQSAAEKALLPPHSAAFYEYVARIELAGTKSSKNIYRNSFVRR